MLFNSLGTITIISSPERPLTTVRGQFLSKFSLYMYRTDRNLAK